MPRRRRFARGSDFGAEPRARRQWVRGTLLGVLGLIPLLGFLGFGLLWLTVPPDDQTARVAGLSAPVDIVFDGNGVPRIRAANERDAAAALGYVHARDRMFQMELMRRAASGRLSELVGSATLPLDKQMRVFGLARLAEGDLAAQSPEARALLEAYATGVNAWIASRGRFAALEFLFIGPPEPWRATDSLLWGRTMSLWLSTNYRTELARQALRDKVPVGALEQLWPPHPAPPPPQASLMDPPQGGAVPLRARGFVARKPGDRFDGMGRDAPDLALRGVPARAGEPAPNNTGAADGPVEPDHDMARMGHDMGRMGQNGESTADDRVNREPDSEGSAPDGRRTGLDGRPDAASVLAALPAFPAPFTLPSTASNAWALDGRFTDTGAPMLAGDPHLSFDFPSLWYLVRIETPGHVLVGATGPGAPFLVLGHNGQIAWTFTTTGADTQDVWLEPADAAFTSRQERIKVRGQPDTLLTVRETRHGPVISDLLPGNGPVMAVAMANLLPRDTGATGLLALDRAGTVEEAGKAAPLIASPVQNLMVADRTKIGLFVTGRIPVRRNGDGWAPMAGNSASGGAASQTPLAPPTETAPVESPTRPPSARVAAEPTGSRQSPAPTASVTAPSVPTQSPLARTPGAQTTGSQTAGSQTSLSQTAGSQTAGSQTSLSQISAGQNGTRNSGDDMLGWAGLASGDALPHIVAPSSGRLINGNEPVWPPDFPVFMGRDTFSDWRARRIRALLDSAPKHSTSDFAAMQVDVISTYAAALLPMLRVVPGAPLVLRDWDGAMTENAPQPLIFSAWMDTFHRAILAKAGIPISASAPVFEFVPFVLSPAGASWCDGDCGPLLKSTLDRTMSTLAARFGDDPATWRWGAVHQAVFAHPILRSVPVLGALTTERIAVPGDGSTLDRGGTNEALEAVHGASFRGVYDLANLERSLFMMTPGQSGNPLSRHARDFLTRWRDGAMVLLAHEPVTVAGTVRLVP